MSQQTNPAWQGAVEVANARLKIIDTALAKLEAAVPEPDKPQPRTDRSQPRNGYGKSAEPESQTPAQSIKSTDPGQVINPAPVPDSSRQALESFLAGRLDNV